MAVRDKTHIELLRIIAIFLVMFNHTWIYGFTYFNSCVDTPAYWFYLFLSIMVKIDVPIFFMISGALLLDKEESIKDLYRKRVLKIVLVLILFSFISYLYLYHLGELEEFSFLEFIKRLYTGDISGQYWFLYEYLGFLVLLPILRVMVKHLEDKHFLYVFIVYLTVQIITIIQYVISEGTVSYNGSFSLFIRQEFIIFPIAGYYVERRLGEDKVTPRFLCWMGFATFVTVAVSCYMTWFSCNIIGEWYESTCQTFFNTLIIVPTVTVYMTVRYIFTKHEFKPIVTKMIVVVGSASFGVYLLEQIYRKETFFVYEYLSEYINGFLASILWIVCAFILGLAVSLLLKQIPGLKKII